MTKSQNRVRFFIFIALFLAVSGGVFADSQWDITLSVPYYAGVKSSEGDVGDFASYLFLLPDVQWHYYWGPEWLRFGPGVRLYTLILESAVYPVFSLESNLGNFVINTHFGGGVFLLFGLVNQFSAEAMFLPEVSVAYRLGKKKQFSIGTSGIFVVASDSIIDDGFAFIGTGFVRWTF